MSLIPGKFLQEKREAAGTGCPEFPGGATTAPGDPGRTQMLPKGNLAGIFAGEFGRNLCRVIGGAAVLGCPSGASGILAFPERFPGSLTSSRPRAPFPVSPEIPKNPIPEFFPERSLPFCVGQGRLGPFPPPQILRDGLFPENWDGIGQGTGSGWDRIAEGWAGNGS